MDPVDVVLGSMLLFAVHLLLVGVLTRYLSGSIRIESADGGSEAVDRDAERVRCPDCGAENDRGYRYCYNCIEELPGGVSETAASAAPSRRGIF